MSHLTIKKSITISAPDFAVWDVLVNQHYTKQWGRAFGEGVHVHTDWTTGSEVTWKDGHEKIIAKGMVITNEIYKSLVIEFDEDLSPEATFIPGNYTETYLLTGEGNHTVLSITSGPLSEADSVVLEPMWDNALPKMKELAEAHTGII